MRGHWLMLHICSLMMFSRSALAYGLSRLHIENKVRRCIHTGYAHDTSLRFCALEVADNFTVATSGNIGRPR